MNSKKPRYYDVIIHVVDRPLKTEDYLSIQEIADILKDNLDIPAGVKIKGIRTKEC